MRSAKWTKKLVVQGLLSALVSSAGTLYAADAKWYDTTTLSGYVEGSYVGNLSSPQQGTLAAKPTNGARLFDQETNSFNLNMFHLMVSKPLGDDGYGFTGKFHTGRDARVIKSGGTPPTSTNPDFDVQEAFVTVATPRLKALTWTGGKFVTLEG